MQYQQHNKASEHGFTLIEMVVAVGVFTVVMIIAVGSLLSVLDANRKAQSVKSALNNINLALDSMSREIRVGSEILCDNDGDGKPEEGEIQCQSTAEGSKFISYIEEEESGANPIVFGLDDGHIVRVKDGEIEQLTSDDATITDMGFWLDGRNPTDNQQPRVVIVIRGFVGEQEGTQTEFTLQTTVSQRFIDDNS